ncbi:MFS transporter [Actinomadura viridis]|uniref:MFS transporter n=1 Tax=Actinomadura viridis TaxID=58110 RepID=UPI0036AF0F7E
MTSDPAARTPARAWWGLAVLLLPALLTSMDLAILFVAGPTIAEALDPTAAQWLWMMDVYGFVMAGLLITMGGLGDRVGRRRMLTAGALLFGAASALIAFAPSPELLIVGRALLGVGGATLAPSTLSLIRAMFADEDRRRTAVGAWTVAFTGGSVAGPIVGGVLLEHFWWGSIFLINVPVMVLLLVAAPFLIPESRGPGRSRFDLPGAAASLPAILSLVYAMKHLTEHGPDGTSATAAVLGIALTAAFVQRQRRAAHPLIDVALFRVPAFAAAVGANTIAALAAAGLGVLAFTFMQAVHGLSPLQAALWALPTFAGTFAGAALATVLGPRLGPAALITSGLAVAAAGFAVIATVEPDTPLRVFVFGYAVLTSGIGIVGTIAGDLILGTAPPGRAGVAAGISETGNELGAALGIAVMGTIANSVYRTTMEDTAPPGTAPAALETVAGATAAEGPAGLLAAASAAYTEATTTAALVSAVLLALVAPLISIALRRGPGRSGPGRPPSSSTGWREPAR